MRILIANAHRNLVGGVEKYLHALIPGLGSRGYELGLLHEYAAPGDREKIDPPRALSRIWCRTESGTPAALESIREWAPDLVYHHGFDLEDSVAVEDALLSAYPVVLYVHNYDRTCGTGQKCFTFPHPEVCQRQIGPMCLVLNYARGCGGKRPDILWRRFKKHSQSSARLPQFDRICVASAHMQAELANHNVPPGKLQLLPLPAADHILNSPPERSASTSKILFVGRLTDLKGVDYLIRAIPEASGKLGRSLTLVVAGDGPEQKKLAELARSTGVPVDFRGWVGTQLKLDLMQQVDLLAVPSVWPEPFGLVGVEAGALGLPAVAYATGGIPDWLIPGETGELAPHDPPTPAGLAAAIVRALGSPEHYARLSLGAWQLAARFTLTTHLDRLEQLFESIAMAVVPVQPAAVANQDAISR